MHISGKKRVQDCMNISTPYSLIAVINDKKILLQLIQLDQYSFIIQIGYFNLLIFSINIITLFSVAQLKRLGVSIFK